ncbi:hypothetical protein UFOVP350_49 [uncultured Caudovirales phage]|uniref:Uncharacterized protein n=1 Tax=uncultured Caudovirales phage TaxID=2100421 RepID=A0A6J5M143_9CAUD|nr:hypothetical protein UFOVP350_49 [uncultured Caudovirales phage]
MRREVRLTIVRDGVEMPLVTPAGLQINVEEHESAFDLEKAVKGGYTAGFGIPVAGNEAALDYQHILAVKYNYVLFSANMYEGDVLLYRGTLAIEESSFSIRGSRYDANFIVDEYSTLVDGKTLQDALGDEGFTFESADQEDIRDEVTAIAEDEPDDVPWRLPPYRNEKQFDGAEDLEGVYKGIVNTWLPGSDRYEWNEYGQADAYLAPWMNLVYVLRKCFTFIGYHVTGDALENAWMKKQLIWGNYTLDDIQAAGFVQLKKTASTTLSGYTWQSLPAEELISDFTQTQIATTGATPYPVASAMTRWIRIVMKTGASTATSLHFGKASAPGIEFIVENPLANTTYQVVFPVTYTGSEVYDGIVIRPFGGDITILPGTIIEWHDDGASLWNKWPQEFKYADCVPAMNISTFLTAVKSVFGLRFDVNSLNKSVRIEVCDDLWDDYDRAEPEMGEEYRIKPRRPNRLNVRWNNEVFDFTPFDTVETVPHSGRLGFAPAISNDLVLVQNEGELYQGAVDNPVGRPNTPAVIGPEDGEPEDVVLKMTLPQMRRLAAYDGEPEKKWLLPVFDQKGSTDLPKVGRNNWPLVFMTYYGIVEDALYLATPKYPMASPYNLLPDGTEIPDSESFDLNAENSILNRQRRMLATLAQNRTVEVMAYDSPARRVKPGMWLMYRNNPWLVKRTEVVRGDDGPVKVEMVPWVGT